MIIKLTGQKPHQRDQLRPQSPTTKFNSHGLVNRCGRKDRKCLPDRLLALASSPSALIFLHTLKRSGSLEMRLICMGRVITRTHPFPVLHLVDHEHIRFHMFTCQQLLTNLYLCPQSSCKYSTCLCCTVLHYVNCETSDNE